MDSKKGSARAKWMKKQSRKELKPPPNKTHTPKPFKKPKHKKDLFE